MSSSDSDIHNTGGPGSSAEPSMEEILASIRRILKEDDGNNEADSQDAGTPTLDDDVLLLDHSMMARPADVSTATVAPVESTPTGEHPATPLQSTTEPLHFSSAPLPFDQAYEAPATADEGIMELPAAPAQEPEPEHEPEHAYAPPEAPAAAPPPPEPEPEPVFQQPAPEPHPTETPMSDQNNEQNVEPPHGLMSDTTTDKAAGSIGALVRSMNTEKSVAINNRAGITIEDIVREEIRPLLKSWLDTHLPSLVERVVRSEIERVIDRSAV